MSVIAADAIGKFPFTTDAGIGPRARIGLVVLASDQTIEHEYRLMLNLPGVAVYESRIYNDVAATVTEIEKFSANDARALPIGHRPSGVIERLARFDLDEHQQVPAPRDDVDLAERAAPAPRQDSKALGDEERRRPALGGDAGAKRDRALRTRRRHWRGGRAVIIGHGRGPW